MIVLDNLLGNTFSELREDNFWVSEKQNDMGWFSWDMQESSSIHSFCSYVWSHVFPKYKKIESKGYEHWSFEFKSGSECDSVGFHMDTDLDRWVDHEEEKRLISCGQAKTADYGFIYYAHRDLCSGGYLEIQREGGELERIQPVPDRIVFFVPDAPHKVTKVTEGVRRSIVSNIWSDTPNKYTV